MRVGQEVEEGRDDARGLVEAWCAVGGELRVDVDCFGFGFAVEPAVASEHAVAFEHAVLSVLNVAGTLTPVAALVHEQGRVCGMATRPGWKSTPEDRRRLWRREAEAILNRAAGQDRP